jgi:hypothetical protein
MNKSFLVFGLKRSGNHAIIRWIGNQFNRYIFFNNCSISKGVPPINPWNNIEINIKPNKPQYFALSNIIYSYENIDMLSHLIDIQTEKFDHKIIIIRDFYNWICSRIKFQQKITKEKIHNWIPKIKDEINLWKQYYVLANSDTNFISIYYNQWLENIEYRKALGQQIGIDNIDDSSMSKVPNYGGVSSFNGVVAQAQTMKVLDRFYYINELDEELRNHIFELYYADDELREYATTFSPDISKKFEALKK